MRRFRSFFVGPNFSEIGSELWKLKVGYVSFEYFQSFEVFLYEIRINVEDSVAVSNMTHWVA